MDQVLCSLVQPTMSFLVMSSQEGSIGIVSMIDGAKPEIKRMNHDTDGAKFQVVLCSTL